MVRSKPCPRVGVDIVTSILLLFSHFVIQISALPQQLHQQGNTTTVSTMNETSLMMAYGAAGWLNDSSSSSRSTDDMSPEKFHGIKCRSPSSSQTLLKEHTCLTLMARFNQAHKLPEYVVTYDRDIPTSKRRSTLPLPLRLKESNCVVTLQTYFHTDALLPMYIFNKALTQLLDACVVDQSYNGGSMWIKLQSLETEEVGVNQALLVVESGRRYSEGGDGDDDDDGEGSEGSGDESHISEVTGVGGGQMAS